MLPLLRIRRSIRKFTKQKIEHSIMDILCEALLRSQSSRNIKPWHFILIDDKTQLKHLAAAKKHGSAFLKDAAAAFVIVADNSKSDVWIEDCSIAAMQLQLTADSLGLGSCWIQIRNRMATETITSEDYVKDHLEIPENHSVLAIIALGHPAETPAPHPQDSLDYSKISRGRFFIG
ncbi:MAG: NAD(P)H-dependent dehydrogenase/reductase, partial [Gammaproteobacteria bacterium]